MFKSGGGLCCQEKELLMEEALVLLLNGLHGCVLCNVPHKGPGIGRVPETAPGMFLATPGEWFVPEIYFICGGL